MHAGRNRSWRHPWTAVWIEDIPKPDTSIVWLKSVISILFFSFATIHNAMNVFLTFLQLSFVTAQCGLQFSSRGVRPGITTVLARHLDKNTMGYLQWRWGIQSSMNTSIVRDTKSSHFTFAMQVCSQHFNLNVSQDVCKLTVACHNCAKKQFFAPCSLAFLTHL